MTEANLLQDAETAVTSYGKSCSTKGLDCAFVYNVIQDGTPANYQCATALTCYLQQIDVVSCAKVPFLMSSLLNLPVGSYVPRAVGRGTYGVEPISPNPFTPSASQQPTESAWWDQSAGSSLALQDVGNKFFDVNFSGLTLYLLYYTANVEDPEVSTG